MSAEGITDLSGENNRVNFVRPRKRTDIGGAPPTVQLGTSGPPMGFGTVSGFGVPGWHQFYDLNEYVPELIWPNSIRLYDRMRTDSQIASLYFGITMPIRRYKWMIDPNGCDPARILRLANNLNLDIVGEEPLPRGRLRDRFSFEDHMRKALLALIYGHMYFEDVGFIDNDLLWTVKKLDERMPLTLQEINVAADGGLIAVKQFDRNAKPIPVDNLTVYIWEGEGANWVGRSLFRDVYKNWLIKDRLMRIDAINHERAGGIPMPIAADDATQQDIEALAEVAQNFHVGESEGAALPPGTKWAMVQPNARSHGPVDSIRYHDESMARRVLMMVAMLAQGGTSLGSYSLGNVFTELFSLGQEAIAMWFRDTFQAYFIEDYWDWNYNDDIDTVPLLTYQKDADESLSVADLNMLITSKALIVDLELEETLRKRYNLPKKGAPRPEDQLALDAQQASIDAKNNPPPNQDPTGGKSSSTATAASSGIGSGGAREGDAPSPASSPDSDDEEINVITAALRRLFKRK